MRLGYLLPLIALALGCASTPPAKDAWLNDGTGVDHGRAPSASYEALLMQKATPMEVAKAIALPYQCENAARRFHALNADYGWNLLRACVDKGEFTQLRALLTQPWLDEMRVRPEAQEVLAAVIAARGGDVPGDLHYVKEQRLHLFDLDMAAKASDRLKDKYVVFRASLGDGKPKADGYNMELAEVVLHNEYVGAYPVDGTFQRSSTSVRGEGALKGTPIGPGDLKGRAKWTTRSGTYRNFYENTVVETGKLIWAATDPKDPFFVPGEDLVVLARLDGVKMLSTPKDDEEPDQRYLVKVVKYWQPSRTMVIRE